MYAHTHTHLDMHICTDTHMCHTYAQTHSYSSFVREEITLASASTTPVTNENWDVYNLIEPWELSHIGSYRGQWAKYKQLGALVMLLEVCHKFIYSKSIDTLEK